MDKIPIRQETKNDYDTVCRLIAEAFKTAGHSDGNALDLASAPRNSSAFMTAPTPVAMLDGNLLGHFIQRQQWKKAKPF